MKDTTLYTSAERLVSTYLDWSHHQERIMQVDWCTVWTFADFQSWFRACLNRKINRDDSRFKTYRKMQREYQQDLEHDAMIIKEHYSSRVRHCGRGILNTAEMRIRYPNINCYSYE